MEEEQNQQQQQEPIFTNSQVQVTIPTFEELQQPQQDLENFLQQISNKFNSNQWSEHFDALNGLREWNKYKSQEFCAQILDNLLSHIMNACENLRSTVQWTCLKLIREILAVNNTVSLSDNCVQKMVVKIFEKANFDKKFLRTEASGAIKVLEENQTSLSGAILLQLTALNFDKNASICEMACQSMANIIKSNMENLKQLQKPVLEEVITTIAKNLEGKRAKMKNVCKDLCIFLNKNLGKEIFEFLNQSHLKLVQQNLEEKKDNKARNFREFKKARSNFLTKSQNMENNLHANNLAKEKVQNQDNLNHHQLVLEKTQSLNINEQQQQHIIECSQNGYKDTNNNIQQQQCNGNGINNGQQQYSNGNGFINSNFNSNCSQMTRNSHLSQNNGNQQQQQGEVDII